MIRKLNRGYEIFGKHRVFLTRNWRSKPKPYWFYKKYPSGVVTLQIMCFEYWKHDGR